MSNHRITHTSTARVVVAERDAPAKAPASAAPQPLGAGILGPSAAPIQPTTAPQSSAPPTPAQAMTNAGQLLDSFLEAERENQADRVALLRNSTIQAARNNVNVQEANYQEQVKLWGQDHADQGGVNMANSLLRQAQQTSLGRAESSMNNLRRLAEEIHSARVFNKPNTAELVAEYEKAVRENYKLWQQATAKTKNESDVLSQGREDAEVFMNHVALGSTILEHFYFSDTPTWQDTTPALEDRYQAVAKNQSSAPRAFVPVTSPASITKEQGDLREATKKLVSAIASFNAARQTLSQSKGQDRTKAKEEALRAADAAMRVANECEATAEKVSSAVPQKGYKRAMNEAAVISLEVVEQKKSIYEAISEIQSGK